MAATKAKKGLLIAVVALLLLAAAVGVLAWLYWPTPEVTAEGYVASATLTAPVFDEEGNAAGELIRGSKVTFVIPEDADETAPTHYKVYLDEETAVWLPVEHWASCPEECVLTETVYVRTAVSLTDQAGDIPYAPVEQGEALSVTGFAALGEDGSVGRWQVESGEKRGWIDAKYITFDAASANAHYDEAIYQMHVSRGNRYGGGDAAGLDFYPREKGDFAAQGNVMPEEVRALYLNCWVLDRLDTYLAIAEGSGINAFVVDIVDGDAVGYPSEVMKQYSPSAYAVAHNTTEEYKAAIQKLKDAGYYVIGRITTFSDVKLAKDHPECVLANRQGQPMKIVGMYWPSAFSRFVWQYKVDLALEAAELMGFNEIQFDYVRFPDGTWRYDDSSIDYRNEYGESKAQAIQRFLTYACDRLHKAGIYVSADVFGETADDYVTAYGQYWSAISGVVDAISAMPYPDHYNAVGDWKPWEHPYETMKAFADMAYQRQQETASPAAVRTWIQCYNAIREPYNTYGEAEVAAQIRALRDAGCTGGYMTWNGISNPVKYQSVKGAFKE